MKIVLDEMVPARLARHLFGHEVSHVVDLGWRHITNGKLLTLCETAGFELFLTKDGNLAYQQNMANWKIAVMVLRPETQDINDLLALAPEVLRLAPTIRPGTVESVGGSERS